jgi:phosphoglycolate phosphatase
MINFPKALVFDLDGTLVDTAPDLTLVLNWLLKREGRAKVDELSVRHMVGRGARHLILQGMTVSGSVPDEAELSRLTKDFITHYGAHIADTSVAFAGVTETLDHFRERGVVMGVCTNKPEDLSRQLLDALDLSQYFSAVLGGDSLAVRKPDPLHLLATLEAMGHLPQDSVMIGDSISDVRAAREAGVRIVGVSFGYTETPIADLNPDIVIDRFADLPQALARMLSGISSA